MPEMCSSHGKKLILCEDCRSQIDQEATQKAQFMVQEDRREAFDRARDQAIALLLSTIEELKMRPEEGGPYIATLKDNFGGDPNDVVHTAIQPREVTPMFDAIFRKLGGWTRLQTWTSEISASGYEVGYGRGLGVATRIVHELYEKSQIQDNHRDLIIARIRRVE